MSENLNLIANKVKIGKVTDAHGIKGEILIHVFSGDSSWISRLKNVVLIKNLDPKFSDAMNEKFNLAPKKMLNDNTSEYLVKRVKSHKKGFICLFEEFSNRNQAEAVIGADVWVDEDVFISRDGESIYLKEILNFEVIDEAKGILGPIVAFSFNGFQDLLILNKPGQKDIEIPFVQAFVSKIDFKQQKIWMNLPEGLVEINDASE